MEYLEKVAAYEDDIMEKIALNKMEKVLSSVGQYAKKTQADPMNRSTITNESLIDLINTSMKLADMKSKGSRRRNFDRHPEISSRNRKRRESDLFDLAPLPKGYNTARAYKPGVYLGRRHERLDEAIARNAAHMNAPKDIRSWF